MFGQNQKRRMKKRQKGKKKTFQKKDRVQVEGRNPVLEALNAKRKFKRILISRNAPQTGKILEIIKKARGRGIEIKFTAPGGLDYISQTECMHQGVIGVLEKRETPNLKKLIESIRSAGKDIFLIIVTDTQDERNLGAVIRSASAAGAGAVIVPHSKRDPVTSLVSRASAGAVEHIPVIAESIFQILKLLKSYDIKIYAVELDGRKSIYEADLKGSIAFVIGGEDKGVGAKVKERCDEVLRIPMHGKAQSLNMSVSAALVIYEKVRQELFNSKLKI